MRKVCGLIVFLVLGADSVSAGELSSGAKVLPVSTESTSSMLKVGDQALNLKLAVKAGDGKGSSENAKPDAGVSGTVEQTSATTKDSKQASARTQTLKPVKRKVLVFKASWCGACQSLNYEWPSLQKVGWRIGEKRTDHIQLVDADQRPDLISRYGISALPTLVLVDGDEEVDRRGSLGARNIAEFYYGRLQ